MTDSAHHVPSPKPTPLQDLQFVMCDPALCLCPGLFRHLEPSDQEGAALESALTVAYETPADGTSVTFRSPALLSGLDASVLLGVAALARASDLPALELRNTTPYAGQPLFDGLAFRTTGPQEPPLPSSTALRTSFAFDQLLKAIGVPSNGRYTNMVRASLTRLAAVEMTEQRTGASGAQHFRLLSLEMPPIDERTRGYRLHVAVNPRLSRFLLGGANQHVRISLEECRKLAGDFAARLLHLRLCGVVNDDGARNLRAETLLGYLWPQDDLAAAADQLRADHVASYARLIRNPAKLEQARVGELRRAGGALHSLLNWKFAVQRQHTNPLEVSYGIQRTKTAHTREEIAVKRRRQRVPSGPDGISGKD